MRREALARRPYLVTDGGAGVSGLDRPPPPGHGGTHFSETHGAIAVAKPNLGLKRVCGSCGTKFYDFGRSPIVCPKCGTVYAVTAASRAAAARAAEAAPAPAEEEVPVAGAEVISLEEADAEATGKKKAPASDVDVEEGDDVEVADDDDADDTFLEEEEEESGDVSDIIGEKLEEDREG
jgi:uncharacterized protein (TIGR02300 family)